MALTKTLHREGREHQGTKDWREDVWEGRWHVAGRGPVCQQFILEATVRSAFYIDLLGSVVLGLLAIFMEISWVIHLEHL